MRKYQVKHELGCASNYGFPLVDPITINTNSKGAPVDRLGPAAGSINIPLYGLTGQVIGSKNLIKAL